MEEGNGKNVPNRTKKKNKGIKRRPKGYDKRVPSNEREGNKQRLIASYGGSSLHCGSSYPYPNNPIDKV